MTLTPGGRACRSPKARVPGKGFCPAGEVLLRRRGFAAGGGVSRRRGFITPERFYYAGEVLPPEGGCPAGEVLLRRRGFTTPERPPLCEGAAPKGLLKAAAPGGQGRPFRREGACPLGRAGQSRRGFFAGERGLCRGVRRPARGRRKACRLRRRGRCNFFGRAASQRGRRGQSSPALRRRPLGPGAKPGRPLRAGGRSAGGCSPLPQNPRKGSAPGGRSPFCPSRPVFFHLYLQEEVQPCSPSTKSIRPAPAWS